MVAHPRKPLWPVLIRRVAGGNQLIKDCNVELTQGCRYGLIGDNGSGKSNVLAAIAQRNVPLPEIIDVFHLHEEAPPTEQTAVEVSKPSAPTDC